jgi:Complex I intermediate-associated protein 30 (CIA30)
VMGGVSASSIRLMNDYALFSGNVSVENSGGFASVRTRNFSQPLNLSNYQGIKLKVKGDGQRYKLFVRTETAWDGLGYAYSFDTSSYDWRNIEVPFKDLIPVFRAKTVNNAPIIDSGQIRSLQVMLSKFEYDGKLNPYFNPGLFSLEIETIAAYGGQPTPQFIYVNIDNHGGDFTPILEASNLPYTIVNSSPSDILTTSLIAVKAIGQSEVVARTLGDRTINN